MASEFRSGDTARSHATGTSGVKFMMTHEKVMLIT
jgi:hypothetical protein